MKPSSVYIHGQAQHTTSLNFTHGNLRVYWDNLNEFVMILSANETIYFYFFYTFVNQRIRNVESGEGFPQTWNGQKTIDLEEAARTGIALAPLRWTRRAAINLLLLLLCARQVQAGYTRLDIFLVCCKYIVWEHIFPAQCGKQLLAIFLNGEKIFHHSPRFIRYISFNKFYFSKCTCCCVRKIVKISKRTYYLYGYCISKGVNVAAYCEILGEFFWFVILIRLVTVIHPRERNDAKKLYNNKK